MENNIMWWIVFGLAAGLLVSLFDRKDNKTGVTASVVMGVIGAIAAGLLSSMYLGDELINISFMGIVLPVGGALILALISRLLFRENNKIKIP